MGTPILEEMPKGYISRRGSQVRKIFAVIVAGQELTT